METRNTDTEKILRTIKFDIPTAQKMERIALKLGRPQRQVFVQMVDYFHRSKKDPIDINDELLKNTLLKQHKDYIGFIRTQESDLLVPMKTRVDRMDESHRKIVDYLNKNLGTHNKAFATALQDAMDTQKNHGDLLLKIASVINLISGRLDTKEQLKKKFLYILDGYIRSRDNFGMMTPAREKEELILKTKKQIELL